MRDPVTDLAAIAAEIACIWALAPDALWRRWRAVFGRKPPGGLSKDLLGRMIAMRLQEQAFGGLDRDSLTFLDGLARRGVPPRRHLKPGTVLVREYQGQRHTVTVGRDGFDWQGSTYPSLSAIARAITGTAWSGPRFFALRAAGDRAQAAGAGAKRRPPGARAGCWTIGRNVRIDYRWAAGEVDRNRTFATELVGLRPDVLLAGGTPELAALGPATRSIPIVFCRSAIRSASVSSRGPAAISPGSSRTTRRSPANGSRCSRRQCPRSGGWHFYSIRRTLPMQEPSSDTPRLPPLCMR